MVVREVVYNKNLFTFVENKNHTTNTMRTIYTLIAALLILSSVACSNGVPDADYVIISTPYGDMRVLLYDDTPAHKQNFLKLAYEGKYDSLLFHRVIRDFMIQGGDPNSLHAAKNAELGDGEIGTAIDAEIAYPKHIHKRGALAAARKPDSANPEKKSSGSQFYIVQGQRFSPDVLDQIEAKRNTRIKNEIFYKIQPYYQDSLKYYQDNGMSEELMDLQLRIMEKVTEMAEDKGLFTIPEEVREVYMTEGGTPHLDGDYTVFGEVVEGLDVIDSIAQVMTDMRDRPTKDIRMSIRVEE